MMEREGGRVSVYGGGKKELTPGCEIALLSFRVFPSHTHIAPGATTFAIHVIFSFLTVQSFAWQIFTEFKRYDGGWIGRNGQKAQKGGRRKKNNNSQITQKDIDGERGALVLYLSILNSIKNWSYCRRKEKEKTSDTLFVFLIRYPHYNNNDNHHDHHGRRRRCCYCRRSLVGGFPPPLLLLYVVFYLSNLDLLLPRLLAGGWCECMCVPFF